MPPDKPATTTGEVVNETLREVTLDEGQKVQLTLKDGWNYKEQLSKEGWKRYCYPAQIGTHQFLLTGGVGLRRAVEAVALTRADGPLKVEVSRTGKGNETRYKVEVIA
jgi:hypothetical protein